MKRLIGYKDQINVMKPLQVLTLIIGMLSIAPMSFGQQDCDTLANVFEEKIRVIGGWDAHGMPLYLEDKNDSISDELIEYVTTTLPERNNLLNEETNFFNDTIQLSTILKDTTGIYLTLVDESAGWKNILGYFTFDPNSPPTSLCEVDSLVVIFPNVTYPSILDRGSKVFLGNFPTDIGVGYFIIAQGWEDDTITAGSHVVFTERSLNTYTTAANRQQTIFLYYGPEKKFLLGFEDQKRPGGDKDFNDAVFYVTLTNKNAVDTAQFPQLASASIKSGATCNYGEPIEIDVTMSGIAPFDLKYRVGKDTITVQGIDTNRYKISTTVSDTISLVSVKDKYSYGVVSGKYIILDNNVNATFDQTAIACESDSSGELTVRFEGFGPWKLTYKDGETEKIISEIEASPYVLNGNVKSTYQLISVSNEYCMKSLSESIGFELVANPTAVISGGGEICKGDSSEVTLSFGGLGPWTAHYSDGTSLYSLESDDSVRNIYLKESISLELVSVTNEFCKGSVEGKAAVVVHNLPTISATLSETDFCAGDSAILKFNMSGSAPFNVVYMQNNIQKSISVQELMHENIIRESASIKLLGLSDEHCAGSVSSDTIGVTLHALPTATISGGGEICGNLESSEVSINFKGSAPYTIDLMINGEESEISSEADTMKIVSNKTTTFKLTSVTDAYCFAEADGSVIIKDLNEELSGKITIAPTTCIGEDIEISFVSGAISEDFIWTTNGAGTLVEASNPVTTYQPADGELGMINFGVMIQNICGSKEFNSKIEILPLPDASFSVSPDKLFTDKNTYFIPANSGYDTYSWDFGNGNGSDQSEAVYVYADGDQYKVSLEVTESGCVGYAEKVIDVYSKDQLYVPNAFNPNALNDENRVVKVYGQNISSDGFYFKIVNRWGNIMYETNDFNAANTLGWDGRGAKFDEMQTINAFTYVLRGKFIDGDDFEITGTVSLIN